MKALLCFALLFAGCSVEVPPKEIATLSWNPVRSRMDGSFAEAAFYRVYCSQTPDIDSNLALLLEAPIPDCGLYGLLVPSRSFYFVSAVDTAGVESGLSEGAWLLLGEDNAFTAFVD